MSKIKSADEIMQIVSAFRMSRVLLTAFELHLFDIIDDKEKSSDETAKELSTDSRATDRLMNALTAMGLLRKKRNKFSNTPSSTKYLVRGKPGYMGGLGHSLSLWQTWSSMTDAVRKGTAVMMRDPINERQSGWIESFITAMHTRAKIQAPKVISYLNLKGISKVLDVGGGSGAFSFAFVKAKKGLRATVFDLPNVINITKKYIEQEGMTEFVSTVSGDYLKNDLGTNYDLVFLSEIIHSNSPDEVNLLFKKCVKALNPGGRLVVIDHIMSEDRTKPLMGALFALNMLVGTPVGDTYTETEIKNWMKEAGLSNIVRKNAQVGNDMIIGRLKQ